MNLIIHQFKTDWRHFRGALLALWVLFAVQLPLSGWLIEFDLVSTLGVFLLLAQVLFGAFLLARIIQADALVGASAQWLTRPMRCQHLFWSKTAFIMICVVLPRMIPQIVISFWHHYPLGIFMTGLAGWWLFNLALVGFLVAVAALTPDLPRFFLMLGVSLGGLFIWIAMYTFMIFYHGRRMGASASLVESALTAALLFFIGCVLAIWIWQAYTGRSRPGLAALGLGLLALPWLVHVWSWDFLTPRTQPLSPLHLSALDVPSQPGDGADGQALWSEFWVAGLPTHNLLVVEDGSTTFTPEADKKTYTLPLFRRGNVFREGAQKVINRVLPMDSSQERDYLTVIRSFFPSETLWNDSSVRNGGGFPSTEDIFKKSTSRPLIGTLQGHWELDQFKVVEAARVPLRRGAWTVAPGIRVVIHELTPQPGGVQVELEEIQATPLLSRAVYLSSSLIGQSDKLCTFVLYQPDWGEAEVVDSRHYYSSSPDLLNGESRVESRFVLPYPVLQERLAGASLRDFVDKAYLCIFVPVYQGTFQETLRQTNFNLSILRSASPNDSDDLKNVEFIAQTTLLAAATAAQTADFLEAILHHLPESASAAQRRSIQSRLEAIGTRGVPLLLARLPLDARTESDYVFPLLTKLATREQLPELREALGRDLGLADWFHQMNWDEDARDILLGKLSDHRHSFGPEALCLAGEAREPATYPELTWHFVRLQDQQGEVAEVLARCPGFDLDGAVREAWGRVRLGLNPPGELALLAAKQGLPDAFNQAVIQLEQSGAPALHRQYQAGQIAALTDFKGPAETAGDWLSAHLGRFRYEAQAHRYRVEGAE